MAAAPVQFRMGSRELHDDDRPEEERQKGTPEPSREMLVNCCCCPVMLPYKYACNVGAPCARHVGGGLVNLALCGQPCWKQKTDFSFPPCCTSIGNVQMCPCCCCCCNPCTVCCVSGWARADRLDGYEGANLFRHGVAPGDVNQGAVGDCWALAAMAALAEFPEAVETAFSDHKLRRDGIYRVKLFDAPSGEWRTVVVDSSIPTMSLDCCCGRLKVPEEPLFARSKDAELWPLLLEKALAKHCGSYAAISGGLPAWALEALTGEPAVMYHRTEAAQWVEYRMAYPISAGRLDAFPETTGVATGNDGLFARMQMWDREKYVVAAGTTSGSDKDKEMGIFYGHAYSVLSVIEAEGFKLVKLRNPHGQTEWEGDWSDTSALWALHPAVARACGFDAARARDEGIFWMPFSTFCDRYMMISAVRPRTTELPHYGREEPRSCCREAVSPLGRCLGDTGKFCCLCGGCQLSCLACMGEKAVCAAMRDQCCCCSLRCCALCRPLTKLRPSVVYTTGVGGEAPAQASMEEAPRVPPAGESAAAAEPRPAPAVAVEEAAPPAATVAAAAAAEGEGSPRPGFLQL